MNQILMREVRSDDPKWIADRLSEDDRETIAAETVESPLAAIQRSVAACRPNVWTVVAQCRAIEEPIAIFGISEERMPGYSDRIGQVWCVGTEALRKRHGIAFTIGTKRFLDSVMGKKFDRLYNREDARRSEHLRWLRACGFSLVAKRAYGPKGLPFVYFARSA